MYDLVHRFRGIASGIPQPYLYPGSGSTVNDETRERANRHGDRRLRDIIYPPGDSLQRA